MRATRRAGVGAALLALAPALAGAPARALEIKQGSGTARVTFLLVQAADHTTPATGLTPTVTISKAGGAFGAGAGAVTELAYGWYSYAASATDTAGVGDLIVHATAAGADPADRLAEVVAYDPADAAALGLARLDAAVGTRQAAGAAVTLPTTPPAGYGGAGASYIPTGTVVAGSTTASVVVSGLATGRNFIGQHLYHQSGESRLIGAQSFASGNYTFTFTATALLPNAFSAIAAGETVKPTP